MYHVLLYIYTYRECIIRFRNQSKYDIKKKIRMGQIRGVENYGLYYSQQDQVVNLKFYHRV